MSVPEVFSQSNRSAIEAECRALAKPVCLGPGKVLGRLLGKYPFFCDPNDTALTPSLVLEGYWEMWVTIALARLVQPGWHVADVGANVGYYTVLLADCVGKDGRVVALEPGGRPRGFLETNVRMNGLSGRTRIHPVAGGANDAEAVLCWLGDDTGCATLNRTWSSADPVHQQRVRVRRLDDLLAGDRLDLLKVDVEGMDYAVLRGAKKTLADNPHCVIVYEHCSAFFEGSYGSSADRLDEVVGLGFELCQIDYDGQIKNVTKESVLSDPDRLWNLVLRR